MDGRRDLIPGVRRYLAQGAVDAVAWSIALVLATLARYDFAIGDSRVTPVFALIPLAVLAQIVAGLSSGLYTGRWRFGSFDEVAALLRTVVITSALVFLSNLWISDPPLIPRSSPLVGGFIALVLTSGARYAWRLRMERLRRPDQDGSRRLLVFGAGEGAAQVITAMFADPDCGYLPVGLLDDDPLKRNLSIRGVKVMGGRGRLTAVVRETQAELLLLAVPSAGPDLVADLVDRAGEIGLPVKILPQVRELLGQSVGLTDIRDLSVSDILGRHEVETDLASVAGYLTGKRVLVTGAGGSIGSELCRQIWRLAPAELVMVDRDESGLHSVELSIRGRGLLDTPGLVLLDLRDRAGVERLIAEARPHVVFHAAALKHLSLLERHPAEAVRTNVWATLDLLESCEGRVERFVNISTDKAADPCSVLGWTKRLTERLTSHFAARKAGTYVSVRFGNVLGSRGSVISAFQAQIAAGGPVTVTHPDVSRFFMTVEEAVALVIQAGAVGNPGEVLVLDMGKPVRIVELARLLARQSPRRVEIEFSGLRPGEKLEEVLLGPGEVDSRPTHPLLSQVPVPPIAPHAVRSIDIALDTVRLGAVLAHLASQPEVEPAAKLVPPRSS